MKIFVKVLLILLSAATGVLFIYSSYTKSFPVYTFEYTMVEYLHFPWVMAALCARLFVGMEAGMGLLMVANIYGRGKWVVKSAFWLLMLFNIYLIYLWAGFGNNVNCGCFGDAIWMSPSASLIKNAILLAVLGILIRFHSGLRGKWFTVGLATVIINSLILPFILFVMPLGRPDWLKTNGYDLDYAPLYKIRDEKKEVPAVDLNKGKYVVAFLSPSCSHCRTAAFKMHLMKQQNASLPFFMIIGGTTSDLTDFWKASQARNIPYTRVDKDNFLKYTGGTFPVILWVNKGRVEAKVDYNNLNPAAIEEWMKK